MPSRSEDAPAEGARPDGVDPQSDAAVLDGLGSGVWVELAVACDVEAVEAVSEILTRHATGGTSVEPGFSLTDEGLGAAADPTRPSTVRAYLPGLDRVEVERSIGDARIALGHLQAFGLRPIGDLALRLVREEDWAEAWKAHFPVLRIGRRLVVRPTWRRHRPRAGDVVLALDPGMAFGTGLHPTTRLCLTGLEAWADEGLLARAAGAERAPAGGTGARALDVGCGSGILSIAAARLGAGEVVALDTDPIAVEATLENARRNRLGRSIRVRRGSVPAGDGPFDLVLANLIASLLVELAPALRGELKPGGRILASGIFRDREGDVREAFAAAGLEVGRRWAAEDWVAIEALAR